jgi:hypothetical protein
MGAMGGASARAEAGRNKGGQAAHGTRLMSSYQPVLVTNSRPLLALPVDIPGRGFYHD